MTLKANTIDSTTLWTLIANGCRMLSYGASDAISGLQLVWFLLFSSACRGLVLFLPICTGQLFTVRATWWCWRVGNCWRLTTATSSVSVIESNPRHLQLNGLSLSGDNSKLPCPGVPKHEPKAPNQAVGINCIFMPQPSEPLVYFFKNKTPINI